MTPGQRKAALYLTSVSGSDRRALLARLPGTTRRLLQPAIDDLRRRGWNDRAAVEQVLSEDLRGLTSTTTLDIETLLGLSRRLPAAWYARVMAASGPVDRQFLLALLDDDYAAAVRQELRAMPTLPPALAGALLEETMALVAKDELR